MHYSAEFFEAIEHGSYQSARIILPLVFSKLHPSSVVDIGCGTGAWMAAAQELGASVIGYDGDWVSKTFAPGLDIRAHDLRKPLPTTSRFDLALCLEVAEHLPAARAETLITELCQLSDTVLFSAAIPKQPGTDHIHCQWQSYWAKEFARNGRIAVDLIRPAVWMHSGVKYWFQQNTILYTTPEIGQRLGFVPKNPASLDLVHPELFETEPSLRQLLKRLPRAGWASLIGRIKPTSAEMKTTDKLVRDLQKGDRISCTDGARTVASITTKIEPPTLTTGGGMFKSAMAMQVEFDDGEKRLAHPRETARIICLT